MSLRKHSRIMESVMARTCREMRDLPNRHLSFAPKQNGSMSGLPIACGRRSTLHFPCASSGSRLNSSTASAVCTSTAVTISRV